MIDWDSFEALIDEPSAENREMLTEFHDDCRMRIEMIRTGNLPPHDAAAQLHQLKGTSANFGFTAFQEAARLSEATAKAGGQIDAAAVAAGLTGILDRSFAEVRRRMPGVL